MGCGTKEGLTVKEERGMDRETGGQGAGLVELPLAPVLPDRQPECMSSH